MVYDYVFPQGTIGQIQKMVDNLASKGWRMVGGLTFTGTYEGESTYVCTMEILVKKDSSND